MIPKDYILGLTYSDWHNIADIPDEIRTEVIELIDESWLCRFFYNDEGTGFKKRIFTTAYLKSK